MLEVCRQLMADHEDVRLQTHINENTGRDCRAHAAVSVGDRLSGDV